MRLIDADALKGPIELQRASYARIGATERAEAYANCLWEIAQAPTIGGWISAKEQLPPDDRLVLAVKQLKDGTRQICLAWCNLDHIAYDHQTKEQRREPYWVCGGNNNIIWWRELPEMPEP